ncbi:MAG: TatD family hydrolase [Halobacteria archaeon]
MIDGMPVLDDHMHCDPRHGEGMEAIKKFDRSGGTHLCVINKPSWHLGVEPTRDDTGEEFRPVFEETLGVTEKASEILEGEAFPILGVHPATLNQLCGRMNLENAERLMKEGMEVAAEYVRENRAIGLKTGRPHYKLPDDMWKASNRIMKHGFELGADLGCAVQLHTEGYDDYHNKDHDGFHDIAEMARNAGMDTKHVVKHFSSPRVEQLTPSVLSRKEWLEEMLEEGREFMMETDYIDDPDRPGAVLGTRTVPKRVRSYIEGNEEQMYRSHVEMPEEVYGVEINL